MALHVGRDHRVLALAAAGLLGCAAAPATRPAIRLAAQGSRAQGSGALAQRIAARVAADPGASVAVAFVDLARADSLFIAADSLYHAASTMKVPVMIQLYRDVDSGRLALNRKLLLANRFASIVDGSPYALDSAADSDTSLYRRLGDSVTVGELVRGMITRSSNLATNTLIAVADARRVTATMRSLGATRMQVLRGVEDRKAFDRGLNNSTTARDLAIVLAALEQGRAASPASTRAMREILLAQEFNEKIPAGLPPGTPVAHKTGEITAVSHDAAIVYPRGRPPYVIVVLTRGISDGTASSKLIVDISRYVFQYATAGQR